MEKIKKKYCFYLYTVPKTYSSEGISYKIEICTTKGLKIAAEIAEEQFLKEIKKRKIRKIECVSIEYE